MPMPGAGWVTGKLAWSTVPRIVEITLHVPPKPSSVPQPTSAWATNGFRYRMASEGCLRRPFGPISEVPSRNTQMKAVPITRASVTTKVRPVEAPVRRVSAEKKIPTEPRPITVANRTM